MATDPPAIVADGASQTWVIRQPFFRAWGLGGFHGLREYESNSMEILSPEFFSALAAIILIDIVLAGDNAIVIALAARNLPPNLRNRAIVWGTVGAVAVRSLMTLAVVWLLKIPGLLALGGLLLLWIAYRLLVNEEHDGNAVQSSSSFFAAMRTIIVADAVMGIDNVLAVAGAAHGSYLLVVLGLLISVPIVVWGSTLILRFTERFPAIIYIGAAVLAVTGTKMFLHEPIIKSALEDRFALRVAVYVMALLAVLACGYIVNQSRRMRRAMRTHVQVRRERHRLSKEGATAMEKVLIPVDGSNNSLNAVRSVIDEFRKHPERQSQGEIILLNVQPNFRRHVAQFLPRETRDEYRKTQSERALRDARDMLERNGISYRVSTAQGDNKADVITAFARQHECRRIVMGTARKNSLTRLMENSVTARLLETAPVPVQVVLGREASAWERFGLPAGVGAAVVALLLID